jgi:hypothetical protein
LYGRYLAAAINQKTHFAPIQKHQNGFAKMGGLGRLSIRKKRSWIQEVMFIKKGFLLDNICNGWVRIE